MLIIPWAICRIVPCRAASAALTVDDLGGSVHVVSGGSGSISGQEQGWCGILVLDWDHGVCFVASSTPYREWAWTLGRRSSGIPSTQVKGLHSQQVLDRPFFQLTGILADSSRDIPDHDRTMSMGLGTRTGWYEARLGRVTPRCLLDTESVQCPSRAAFGTPVDPDNQLGKRGIQPLRTWRPIVTAAKGGE